MRAGLVINNQSGGIRGGGEDSALQTIRGCLKEAGISPLFTYSMGSANGAAELAARVDQHRLDCLIAAGGDGTLNFVANALRGSKIPIAIIPQGTFNLLAKSLKIPLSVSQACGLITEGHQVALDCGDLDGRLFLVDSILGLYPEILGPVEEESTLGSLGTRVIASLKGLKDFALIDMEFHPFGKTEFSVNTALAFISPASLDLHSFAPTRRIEHTAGELVLQWVNAESRRELVADMMAGSLTDGEEIFETCEVRTTKLTVRFKGDKRRVSLDGEILPPAGELHYRLIPKASVFFVPRDRP